MAALAGGKVFGVAKNATLVAVRVLDRDVSGTVTRILAGLEYVANEKSKDPNQPMVVSMSLGIAPLESCVTELLTFQLGLIFGNNTLLKCLKRKIGRSSDLTNAVDALVQNDGVLVMTSAGNSLYGAPACLQSPANSKHAITAGGSTYFDFEWIFTKKGLCVDILAPADNIKSAWYTSDGSTTTASGSSASAPQVAGVAALYLQRTPTLTPKQVKSAILRDASIGGWLRSLFSPFRVLSTVKLIDK
jgi:subtilisin family serine protease